jgi:uncharacterized protein YkwD
MLGFRIGAVVLVAVLAAGGAIVVAARGADQPVPRLVAPATPRPSPSGSTTLSPFEPVPGTSPGSGAATLHALNHAAPTPPGSGAPPAAPPSRALPAVQANLQLQATDQARAAAGLAPLTWSSCLAAVAAAHADQMANAGAIYHGDGVQRDLACGPGPERSGENVGEAPGGIDDQQIFDAFMASPDHRDNILGPYRFFAAAWVIGADGKGYVSVEFLG